MYVDRVNTMILRKESNQGFLWCKNIEPYRSILLLIGDLYGLAREFPGFADGSKGCTKTHGHQRSKEESASIETHDYVNFLVNVSVNVVHDVGDHHFHSDRILEQGEDVLEQNPGLWKVGNLSDKGVDALEIHCYSLGVR
jgi:hypothetical protein